MGTLEYNSSRPPIDVDDSTLAHLKVIIGTKLRRRESFMMTWVPDTNVGAGRMTIWMNPSIPLIIAFEGKETPAVDGERLKRMMELLNTRGELVLDQLT